MNKKIEQSNKKLKNKNGITLVALVITIIILLILAGISISALTNTGIFGKAREAKEKTIEAQEKEQIQTAYFTASMEALSGDVTGLELQEQLNKTLGNNKVAISYNADTSLNILFKETKHNFKVDKGEVTKTDIDNSTIAFFDTGLNVTQKMYNLASDGQMQYEYIFNNLSIDGIERATKAPELSKMTEDNIVSWTEAYTQYETNPSEFEEVIPEGTELCPIYMWFEETGEEVRSIYGDEGLTEVTDESKQKLVRTGTIYWWCKSDNVYLNPDASHMFLGLPYVSDISGLQSIKTDYTQNMEQFLTVMSKNQRLKSFDELATWNTSKVTNLSSALAGYEKLENINGLKYWNTSNVTNMASIFGDGDIWPTEIKDLNPLKNWDVSNVEDMSHMFDGSGVTDLNPLKDWNVSKVKNMSYMFRGNSKIIDASPINDWDIRNVTNFEWMFDTTHPEFTKVTGTWENGTFKPNSN